MFVRNKWHSLKCVSVGKRGKKKRDYRKDPHIKNCIHRKNVYSPWKQQCNCSKKNLIVSFPSKSSVVWQKCENPSNPLISKLHKLFFLAFKKVLLIQSFLNNRDQNSFGLQWVRLSCKLSMVALQRKRRPFFGTEEYLLICPRAWNRVVQ